jgi:putative phosphoribosyl transferase
MCEVVDRTIRIRAGEAEIEGTLSIPSEAKGVVLFAHGSGSSRFSPRNQFVARYLREAHLGTLLIDLLEEWESEDRSKVFDIDLLAERVISATYWLKSDSQTQNLAIGYFGASTGAAAALEAAAKLPELVRAVVSRGGRPDLAMQYLPEVRAPVLLIVGGNDWPVVSMNQEAYERLACVRELVIIPGAGHLFEEPGALEEVARLARDWFVRYLVEVS